MIIVIDDERKFDVHDEVDVHYFQTAQEALYALVDIWNMDMQVTSVVVDELWLDHDLGKGGNIMVVVNWLHNIAFGGYRFPVNRIYVHSQNPAGADNIVGRLCNYYNVRRTSLPVLES